MRRTTKAGQIRRRLVTGFFCISLLLADLGSVSVAWAKEEIPSVSENTPADPSAPVDGDKKETEKPGGETTAPAEGEKTEKPDGEISAPAEDGISGGEMPAPAENGDGAPTVSENDAPQEEISVSDNDLTMGVPAVMTAEGDDIASGKSNDIEWRIDAAGKLTVEGSGDWEYTGTGRRKAPWDKWGGQIKTAEVKVTGMTDASGMFYECYNMTAVDLSGFHTDGVKNMSNMFYTCYKLMSLDVSGFDTSQVTDMSYMFEQCNGLTSLDLSGFNTSQVTDMQYMFAYCYWLESLDVSGFDTSQVTDMSRMFSGCNRLESLDVGGFDTSRVTDMSSMFSECGYLESLDVSGFDTSRVIDMSSMFLGCGYLESLDVSGFDTSQVRWMSSMFLGCGYLESLDVSGFDTSQVRYMDSMFFGCSVLTSLDLSGFDTSQVTNMSNMFKNCSALTTICTPCNVNVDCALPDGTWYAADNSTHTALPKDLSYSLFLQKGSKPEARLQASKRKTAYDCGETLSLNDLTVTYYGTDGRVRKLKPAADGGDGYTTNAAQIDMTTPGEKTLIVSYTPAGGTEEDTLTAEITLTVTLVTFQMTEANTTVTLPDAEGFSYVYTGSPLTPEPVVKVTVSGGTETEKTLIKDTDYTVSYTNNVNACVFADGAPVPADAPAVTITGKGGYIGTVTQTFSIAKAAAPAEKMLEVSVTDIRAEKTDRTVDLSQPFAGGEEPTGFRVVEGSVVEDDTVAGAVFKTPPVTENINEHGVLTYATNAGTRGDFATFQVMASFANYEDAQLTVKIILFEETVTYRVTLDWMGHGARTPAWVEVEAGSLIELAEAVQNPQSATEDGKTYLFIGWYRDQDFVKGKEWNFAADTVDGDMTLYACWRYDPPEEKPKTYIIQDIEDLTFTGSAQKPAVVVYDSDGETLLKPNKDYTVKYFNNMNAGGNGASGAVAEAVNLGKKDQETFKDLLPGRGEAGADGAKPGFDKTAPYVAVIGKGNYTQTVCKNFCIRPAAIGDGAPAAGVTLKYTDQLTVNKNKEQNVFGSLKYKKAMKAGTDFTVSLSVESAQSAWTTGTDGTKTYLSADWKKEGQLNGKKYVLPMIPKGGCGAFLLTVKGAGNYAGEIRRTIHVSEKQNLMKNASITLGRNQKTFAYTGEDVLLTPGYYDAATKKYHKVTAPGIWSSETEANADDIFLVKAAKNGKAGGESLVWGKDYTVDYSGTNRAVGTATMTITGMGDYAGTKSVTFKITGEKFAANTVDVKAYDAGKPNDPQADAFRTVMSYTGKAVTQDTVYLSTKPVKATGKTPAKPAQPLVYGTHYTVSYKNNVKKGTATMIFTARPESGYSGSFQKTFKIGEADIAKEPVVFGAVPAAGGENAGAGYSLTKQTDAQGNPFYQLNGTVDYSREGAKPADHIVLTLIGENEEKTVLKEGTDYTVSYADNTVRQADEAAKKKQPAMTVKGKGNYKGSVKVFFHISDVEMKANPKLTVTAAATAFNAKQQREDYLYQPKITVKDGKKALTAKDYKVAYHNNTQKAVKEWLDALETLKAGDGAQGADAAAWAAVYAKRPYAEITALAGSGYKTGEPVTVDLSVYRTKFTANTLYILVDETGGQTTYNGTQRTPAVTVYCGEAKAVRNAKKDKVTDEAALTKPTAQGGAYGLTKLTKKEGTAAGDYTVSYGANIAAGKNKGSVTVTGTDLYGAGVTVKFTIKQKPVFMNPTAGQ